MSEPRPEVRRTYSTARLFAELCVLTLTIVTLILTSIVAAGLHHTDYNPHHTCMTGE